MERMWSSGLGRINSVSSNPVEGRTKIWQFKNLIITLWVSYKKQELLILCEHLSSFRLFGGFRVAHLFSFLCCPIMCIYVLGSVLWCPLRFPHKTMFGSSLTPVVCWGLMSYLRYLCLFACSGVQHISCCVFVLFFFVLCTLCCQCLWINNFLIAPSMLSNVYL
jgi:hypothetical protein